MNINIKALTKSYTGLKKTLNISLTLKLLSMVTVLILLVAAISNLILYNLSFNALKEEIRNNIIALASNSTVSINSQQLETITKPEDEGNAVYLSLQKTLQNIKNSSNGKIRYVYTLMNKNEEYFYVLDASPINDKENHSSIGEQFIVQDYTYVKNAFKYKKTTSETKPTSDEVYGGITQTGYAPIIDQTGNVIGVLGIDIDVTVLDKKERSFKEARIIALLLAFIMAITSGLLFSKYLTKPIFALIKGTNEIAEGDFDTVVNIKRTDEFGQLSNSFNKMSQALKISHNLLDQKNQELEKNNLELIDMQQMILQQEKMASIGQLAAGVAHEINNPMGFITSNICSLRKYTDHIAEFLSIQDETIQGLASIRKTEYNMETELILNKFNEAKKSLQIDYIMEDTKDLITETLGGADRVKTIVHDLRTFSRTSFETSFADINKGIQEVLNIIWNQLKYKITLKQELGDIPLTCCNIGQLNQVFMNVLINATQSIDTNGDIFIKTCTEANNIIIIISDTGCGMSLEIQNKIFEPFFTTKDVGKGTGLGLSISYEILKKHNGSINVISSPGKGTTFTLKVPIKND